MVEVVKLANGLDIVVFSEAEIEELRPTERTYAAVAIKMQKNDFFYEPTEEEIAARIADSRERVDCLHAVADRRKVPLWKVTEEEIAAERATRHPPEQTVADFDTNRSTVAPQKPQNALTRFINKLVG